MRTLWQKSSYSGVDAEDCLELAPHEPHIALRESETPDDTLTATPKALAALIRACKTPAGRQRQPTQRPTAHLEMRGG
ncbi:DUF397 domain-containing protein [Streptomyces sp. NPDC048518]|uniref:DUF397 domain-containing protein n=1 Tax=Streptomyces sp. NPDC048518 TaxID=3155029 RepID=UPI0033C349AB